jgi:TPR repeat protein
MGVFGFLKGAYHQVFVEQAAYDKHQLIGLEAVGREEWGLAFCIFRHYAEFGIGDAQQLLASLYEEGLGVTANKLEAYKWYRLAATYFNHSMKFDYWKAAENRAARVAATMTTSDIEKAKKAEREWKRKPFSRLEFGAGK